IQHCILWGSDDEEIEFTFVNEKGRRTTRIHPFEGVIPNMRRRYQETESAAVREDLARYLTTTRCPVCESSRLKKEARNVFIVDITLPRIPAMRIENAFFFLKELRMKGNRAEIAVRILK